MSRTCTVLQDILWESLESLWGNGGLECVVDELENGM